jgi:hypothetical protein
VESSSGTPSRPTASGGTSGPGASASAGTGSLEDTSGSPVLGARSVISSSSSTSTTVPPAQGGKAATKPAPVKPAPAKPSSDPVRVASGAAAAVASVGAAAALDDRPVTAERPPVAPTPTPAPATRPTGPRRARLLVTRLDPWSVMKTAFMLSISIGIVLLMATALLWWTLSVTGVFSAIGRTVNDIAGTSTTSFDFLALVSFSRVMGVALVLAAVEVVLVSALTTLFAFLYNLSVGLTGGLEVTLSEDA